MAFLTNDFLTMRRLGNYGQWGNQITQYAFLRVYARRFGLRFQVPPWGGQFLYGFRDELPEGPPLNPWFERYRDHHHGVTCTGQPVPPVGDEVRGRDFQGWAQYDTAWYAPDRDFMVSLYETPAPEVAARVAPAVEQLRRGGRTVVSLHLRRGDSGRMIWFFTPVTWCLQWLRGHWRRLEKPVLFVTTEEDHLLAWFAHYHPVTIGDLGIELRAEPYPGYTYPYEIKPERARQIDFFPDWYVMQQSDVLLAAESTFSFTAALYSRRVRELWRPRLSIQAFERDDPWNTRFSHREHLDDYRGIPGTQITVNPMFAEAWGDWRPTHESVPEDPEEIARWMTP